MTKESLCPNVHVIMIVCLRRLLGMYPETDR